MLCFLCVLHHRDNEQQQQKTELANRETVNKNKSQKRLSVKDIMQTRISSQFYDFLLENAKSFALCSV